MNDEKTLLQRSESVNVGADFVGRRAGAGDLALDILRAIVTHGVGPQESDAATILIRRIDEQIESEAQARARDQRRAEKQADVNALIAAEIDTVRIETQKLFDSLKPVVAARSHYGGLPKPDDIATLESGTVRVSRVLMKNGCVESCSRAAKFATWRGVTWRRDDLPKGEYGLAQTETEFELVGMCGQHVKEHTITFAVRRLVERKAISATARFTASGSRYRTYAAVEAVKAGDPYLLLQGAIDRMSATEKPP
jgi:hypothetical protein